MVQAARFVEQQNNIEQQQQQQQHPQQQQQLGELHLTGYVRAQGLSANQLITVPGAGDFRILRIEGPVDPAARAGQQQQQQQQRKSSSAAAVDMDMADAAAAAAAVLVLPDPEQREPSIRENVPDPLEGMTVIPAHMLHVL
jgi:pre-rRNA-processing protein TSR1